MAIAVVVSIAAAIVFRQHAAVAGFFLGVGGSAIIALLDMTPSNKHHRKLLLQIFFHPKERVRVSISYLFRIHSTGRYLLIRGSRYPDQFQPVGGVYKIFPSGSALLRTQFAAVDDNLIPIDADSVRDLRVRVPGRDLLKFMTWFETGEDRECTPSREFYEELILPGFASSTDFEFLMPQFVKRHYEPLRYSEYAKSKELLIADIFELELSSTQLAELENAVASHPQNLTWATVDEIERRGAVPGQAFTRNIALPARWLL